MSGGFYYITWSVYRLAVMSIRRLSINSSDISCNLTTYNKYTYTPILPLYDRKEMDEYNIGRYYMKNINSVMDTTQNL